MSKSADEQATEVLVAVLASKEASAYLGGMPDAVGKNISTIWQIIYDTIYKAKTS